MTTFEFRRISRRNFLKTLLALPIPLLLAACGRPIAATATPIALAPTPTEPPPPPTPPPPTATPTSSDLSGPSDSSTPSTPTPQPTPEPAPTAVVELLPTPACPDDDDVTPPTTAGPFYTPNSPQRNSLLEAGMPGTRLVLSGLVLTTGCQPIAGALLDFWHADDAGVYDNVGYRLRGHQFADGQGRYQLETIVPGLYPGRTRHYHVRVQAPHGRVLVTQLFFPGEPGNNRDGIYRSDLEMDIQESSDGLAAVFDFVLAEG